MGSFIAGWLLVGCVKNPVTGRLQLDLMGEQNEIEYGQSADASLTEQIGLYEDEDLSALVSEIGAALAAVSERPELPWTFKVLDDATVNAFAVPGGHVYVTRGLLAHLQTEDELAVVLGHEVGHVAARHSVVQLSKGVLLGLGVGAVSVFDPHQRHVGKLASQGAESLFLSFSRADELAADALGVRYVAAIDRDPGAFLPVFDMLQRVEDAATGGERLPTRLRTHPQSAERTAAVEQRLDGPPSDAADPGWLARLDGIVVGPNPREGFFVGSTYLHPSLGFRLELPEGWEGENTRTAILASPPTEDALLSVTLSSLSDPREAMARFAEGVEHGALPTDPSAGLSFSISGEMELRGIAAYIKHGESVLEIVGLSEAQSFDLQEAALRTSIASFRTLTDPEVVGVQPMRVVLYTADQPTTLRALDERSPSSLALDTLSVLNRLDPDRRLEAGRLVKRVEGFNPDRAPEAWKVK